MRSWTRAAFLAAVWLVTLYGPPVLAQNGDHAGEPQPENWRRFEIPAAKPLSAEDQLATFRVAPGFRVELVAAEPLVVDPIAIEFDASGRLWAVELRSFMPDVDGNGETEPRGQIVVLEDVDRDGRYDRSSVFLDGLVNARALSIVRGGVLIAEPPFLWYCRDTDGDLRADWKMEVARYGDPNPDHLEHTENGLKRGLDNWIYSAKSSRRLELLFDERGTPRISSERTAFRGQWGITKDDRGRLYYNGNSNYLFGDPWPAEYLLRGTPCGRAVGQPPGIGERIVPDEAVHSIRTNTGINRGYQRGMLRNDGRLARTTSVSGGTIYRGHQFPAAYRGDAFIPEPAGNVLAHFRIADDGVQVRGEQQLSPDPDWNERAFLASTDERFRPVDCTIGPDGALYVVDLYRGILQHRQFVTSYLRKQILERGLDQPVGLGRIWRVVAEDREIDHRSPAGLFADAPTQVRALGHPNGWVRDTAQRVLVDAGDRAVLPLLVGKARESGGPLGRVHALWTLEGLGAVDAETVGIALGAKEPEVRIATLRVSERLAGSASANEVLETILRVGDDPDRAVRIQRVFTLGEFQTASAIEATIEAVRQEPEDASIRLAALSGWGSRQEEILERLTASEVWPESSGGLALLRELAASRALESRENTSELLALADRTHDPFPERSLAIIDGVIHGIGDRRQKPVVLDAPPALFSRVDRSEPLTERLERLAPKLRWSLEARAHAAAESTPLPPLGKADAARAELGRALFQTCTICHGPQGEGLHGLGPSLRGSPRLEANAEQLVRIILDGITGPLIIDGIEWNTTMPGQRANVAFSDEAIAGLLTWLGRKWGNRGAPVSPDRIREIRSETQGRSLPWNNRQLEAISPATHQGEVPEGDSRSLFDGKTLLGWAPHGGRATYRAEGGSIVGRTVPNSPNSFLCTEKKFGDFELIYEFKIDPELNSGVQIRSRVGEDKIVRGYQVEIDVDTAKKRYWSAGLYEEGGRGWLADLSKNPEARGAAKPTEWNRVRVLAVGGRIQTWINDVAAADLLDVRTLSGIIGLQVHGVGGRKDPLEVRWRNLRIRDLGSSRWEDQQEPRKWRLSLASGPPREIDGNSSAPHWRWTRSGWLGTVVEGESATLLPASPATAGTYRYRLRLGGAALRVGPVRISKDGISVDRNGVIEVLGGETASAPADWQELVVQQVPGRLGITWNGSRIFDEPIAPEPPSATPSSRWGLTVEGDGDTHVMIRSIESMIGSGGH